MEDDIKLGESSKFGEATLQIMRLHNLWEKIEENVNKGNLKEWQHLLDSVWRELRADVNHLKEPEKTIKENKLLKFRVLVAASKTRAEWNKDLNERHEFLKQLQDESGKGATYENKGDINENM